MKQQTRKVLVGILSVCLVLTLSIGGTLAFMTQSTEKRVNNFTFADGDSALDAKLTEPEWDGVIGYEYDANGNVTPIFGKDASGNNIYGYTDGDITKPITDKTATGVGTAPKGTGIYDAQNMIPGQTAAKNPIITNLSTISDEWVAAKITFVYGEGNTKAGQPLSAGDMTSVTEIIDINWNVGTGASNWDRVAGGATDVSQTFYYRSIIAKAAAAGADGGVTAPLFTTVSVKETASSAQIKALEAIGGFAIYIEGFAAQSDAATNYDGFRTWGATNVVFNNTPTAAAPADVTKTIIAK